MIWSKEETVALIYAYKKRPMIWNPKHKYYFHKIKKNGSWEEVAKEIGRSAEDCKRKMEGLLSSLRRENMKKRKFMKTSNGDKEYESTWYAYKCMQFLTKKKSQAATEVIDNDTIEENLQLPEDAEVEDVVSSTPSHPSSLEIFSTRCHINDEYQNIMIDDYEPSTSTSQPPTLPLNDDSQQFGNLVATKLRKYDETTRCAIQNAIMGIFLNASRGYYHQNNLAIFVQSNNLNSNLSNTCNSQLDLNVSRSSLPSNPGINLTSSNFSSGNLESSQQSTSTSSSTIHTIEIKEEFDFDSRFVSDS